MSGDPTLSEVLARVRRTTLEAFDHQEAPFEKVMERLRRRGVDTDSVFQVLLSFEKRRSKAGTAGISWPVERHPRDGTL